MDELEQKCIISRRRDPDTEKHRSHQGTSK
jgi:hypothetical protein